MGFNSGFKGLKGYTGSMPLIKELLIVELTSCRVWERPGGAQWRVWFWPLFFAIQ